MNFKIHPATHTHPDTHTYIYRLSLATHRCPVWLILKGTHRLRPRGKTLSKKFRADFFPRAGERDGERGREMAAQTLDWGWGVENGMLACALAVKNVAGLNERIYVSTL